MKEKRDVPVEVRERVKRFAGMRKVIKKALEEKPLTILQIAGKTGMQPDRITYYLMTLRKFGEIEVVDDDDVDDYYCYRLKE